MYDLMENKTISAMVENYEIAMNDMQKAYELLEGAGSRLKNTFGEGSYFKVISERWGAAQAFGELKQENEKRAWSAIVRRANIRSLLSKQRLTKLDKTIEMGEMQPLTVDNIQQFLKSFAYNINGLLEEVVQEVFKMLTPDYAWSNYKTNSSFAVGKKVILTWWLSTGWGVSINYSNEDQFRLLDNCFSLLDGKGTVKYPSDLLTNVKQAIQDKLWTCETPYFKCKWYKNGNMHVEFKRMDLVKRLNQIGGQGNNNLDKGRE